MSEMNVFRNIKLKDVWSLFTRRWIIIVLAGAIAAGGLFAYDRASYKPSYSSTATLYIKQLNEGTTSAGDAYNEFSLALRLVKDCTYLLKSRTVLQTVIDELGLKMSYSALYSRVSTSNPSSTRILEVTVTGDDPAMTKAIVDKICDIGPAKIQEAMGISQVNLYEYGTDPVLSRDSYNLLIYGVIGAAASLLVFGIFLLAFILDDRIRSDEDVERYLGLSILVEIPDLNNISKDRYGYYRGYGESRRRPPRSHNAPKKEG